MRRPRLGSFAAAQMASAMLEGVAMAAIVIFSPKGGVGKTSLAVNLAWASATLSRRRTLL